MTNFKDRELSFEKKFALDEEAKFKAKARGSRLVGVWAAEKLGLAGTDADAYAKAIVMADIEKPGSDSVFSKIRADFDSKGVAQSDHQIRRTMDECMLRATAEIKSGK